MNQDASIAWLTQHYPGPTAARALWLWAGGKETDMVYTDTAEEQWPALFKLARELDSISWISIFREALFDYPGDETILSELLEIPRDVPDADQTLSELFAVQLTELAPGLDPGGILAALHVIPDITRSDMNPAKANERFFVLLAPSLNNRLTRKDRKTLRSRLSGELEPTQASPIRAIADGMKALVFRTRDWCQSSEESAFKEIEAELKTILDSVSQSEEIPSNSALDPADSLLEKLSDLIDPSEKQMGNAAINGLKNQLNGLRQAMESRLRSFEDAQSGLFDALWATCAQSDDHDDKKES